MKLAVHLVTYNGARYIPFLFRSLRSQTFTDWELLVIDNQSTDETVKLIQTELINFPVAARLIVNTTNMGFASGHNQALRETTAPFFVLLNQDTMLAPNCFENLVAVAEQKDTIATVQPALYRWDFANGENGKTNTVDSFGLKVFRNRRVIDMVESTPNAEIFGASGALMLLRRAAVIATTFADGTFLDENYFMYKEDVDLAFRLRSAGYCSWLASNAQAYHDRTGSAGENLNDLAAAKNKSQQAPYVRYYSYRNHIATLYKNDYWQNFILDFPWILWYEIKKFGYFLLFDRQVLRGLLELTTMHLTTRRAEIVRQRKNTWRAMRSWYA